MLASVGVLRFAPLALLLCGCFADPGRYRPGEGSSTSTEATTNASMTVPPTSGDATTTAPTTSDATSEPTGSTVTGPTDATTTATETGTTSPPLAECGNGEIEPGEVCDDGDLNGGASCNLDCSAPSCDDLVANQGESDVDCGGPCMPCAACLKCNTDADCAPSIPCAAGVCAGSKPVALDYVLHCAQDLNGVPAGPAFPTGTYRITALGGGGATMAPPSYGWLVQCVGLDLAEMSVPFTHLAPEQAFAALPVPYVVRPYPGGPIRCGLQDISCADNMGGVSLSFAPECP